MSTRRTKTQPVGHHRAQTENTVPLFWPFELAAAIAKGEMGMFSRGLATLAESEKLEFGLKPAFATANKIVIELHTLPRASRIKSGVWCLRDRRSILTQARVRSKRWPMNCPWRSTSN